LCLLHFLRDRVRSIFCPTIRAGPYQEMGFSFLRGAEEFIAVAFPIPHMNASLRLIPERGRLLQVLQPADAFLLFNRNPCRINLLFERIASLELLSRPELHGRDAERQAFRRDHEAGMYQEATHGVYAQAPGRVLATVDLMGSS